MSFPPQWHVWIWTCTMSASASILVNGSATTPFKLQRGLSQGDPLSPFLFNLIVEPLNLLIHKATLMNLWEGIVVCRNGFKIYILSPICGCTITFCTPNTESLLNIKNTFICFQLASGLHVNFQKAPWLAWTWRTLKCKTQLKLWDATLVHSPSHTLASLLVAPLAGSIYDILS